MTLKHIEAAFEHTVFVRPEGGSFTSVKSKYIALDHVVIKSPQHFELSQVCDVEITLLDSVSGKPIKLKAKVTDSSEGCTRLDYVEVSELSIQKLEKIIFHYTRQPIEFESEVEDYEEGHTKKGA